MIYRAKIARAGEQRTINLGRCTGVHSAVTRAQSLTPPGWGLVDVWGVTR